MGGHGGRLSQERASVEAPWWDELDTYVGTEERLVWLVQSRQRQEKADSEVLGESWTGCVGLVGPSRKQFGISY